MTLIRVNPESVRQYGLDAQSIFESIHQTLTTLVNDIVAVHYYGPNSVLFKTESGRMATEFSHRLHLDMEAMATAVRSSTSNIAHALGGVPISISFTGRAVVAPQPTVVDYVDVDTSALDALLPVISSRFDELRHCLDRHLAQLAATDWQGQAKTHAVDAVTRFTSLSKKRCTTAETEISSYIRRQIESVLVADR
ncbi:MAG: hypothetical protein CSA55_05090 [Ilumatobacter coccineus]|uniref:Uncharacterized protein n=1 Tax=Ilumatobacter coccineus TaxID=467094 RepID=A0A2G6K7N7_9ACTN|nr:MAG: hypothetical protein CSA55_05090 [Ilumatobacter coccineus]